MRRCERIRWIRSFMENYSNYHLELCLNCAGIKIWSEPIGKHSRVHLLLEEENYIVVIEKRENYYLLITAFYIEYDYSMQSILKRYQRYRIT